MVWAHRINVHFHDVAHSGFSFDVSLPSNSIQLSKLVFHLPFLLSYQRFNDYFFVVARVLQPVPVAEIILFPHKIRSSPACPTKNADANGIGP